MRLNTHSKRSIDPRSGGEFPDSLAESVQPITEGPFFLTRNARHIERQIASLQAELANMSPMDAMSTRELAKAAGVGHATAHRAKRGEILGWETMVRLLPFMCKCPCCEQKMSKAVIAKAQAKFKPRKN